MLWWIFAVVVLAVMSLDLGVFNRKARVVGLKEALLWSLVWIALALGFCGLVYFWRGPVKALEFLTGYVVEESLSVDNLFVFIVIFSFFKVPREYERKVLFLGIIGVLITRGIFITTGVTLIQRFDWMFYIFGAILIYTAFKLAFGKAEEIQPEKNPVLKFFHRFMPVTQSYEGGRFFVRKDGRLYATALFVVLLVIESTDVVFAVDSVPAVLGITHDPFIVYTSNVFAILGLRSLFFLLSGIMNLFDHLHYGLAFILGFVGVKMLIAHFYPIPIGWALGVIAVTLLLSILASLIWPSKPRV